MFVELSSGFAMWACNGLCGFVCGSTLEGRG